MRVLLVTSRHPVPPWRGNQVRTTEWLEALSDFESLLVCPRSSDPAAELGPVRVAHYPLSPVTRAARLLRAAGSGLPLQEGLYDSGAARRVVARAVSEFLPDVVIVQMVRCAWAGEAVHSAAGDIPIVFDAIDSMGLHFDRAGLTPSPCLAPLVRNEAARCRRRESWLSGKSRLTVAVSARDLAELSVPEGRGRVIPVAGRKAPGRTAATPEKVVLLSGNLGYRPTVEGALWFAREVWPGVRSRVPDARWILAGARPAPAIRQLSRLDGVEVHADVPDLGAFVSEARVAVAPMTSGSGVPMKVLEAMAAGVAAVVHPWAADGLVDGAADAVTVAGGTDSWVESLVRLLEDENAADDLGARGRELWRQFYHPEVVAQQVRDVIVEAAKKTRERNSRTTRSA